MFLILHIKGVDIIEYEKSKSNICRYFRKEFYIMADKKTLPHKRHYRRHSKRQLDKLRLKMLSLGIPHKCAICGRKEKKDWKRKRPVLVVDHINGNEKQINGNTGIVCGNVRFLCYKCNKDESIRLDKEKNPNNAPHKQKLSKGTKSHATENHISHSAIMREAKKEKVLPFIKKYHSKSKYQLDKLRSKMISLGIKEECVICGLKENKNGKKRRLGINFINGNKKQIDGDTGIMCGNVRFLCCSCTQKESIEIRKKSLNPNDQIAIDPSRAISYESRVKTIGKPQCLDNIDNAIKDSHNELCESTILAAPEVLTAGVSKTKFLEYYEQNLQRYGINNARYHRFKIEDYMCENLDDCNGVHVTLKGLKPTLLIQKEKIFLEKKYEEYLEKLKEKNDINKVSGQEIVPAMTSDQFYNQQAVLAKHDFGKFSHIPTS